MEVKKNLTSANQRFTYRVLSKGIRLMLVKGIEPFKRAFVCKAMTIGYFNVPQFRKIFIA